MDFPHPPWVILESLSLSCITKIFLVSDFDFCTAIENCCPLALLLLYRASCSVLWSCLWESLGCVFLELQGPKLAWSAVSDTCLYWASKHHFVTLKQTFEVWWMQFSFGQSTGEVFCHGRFYYGFVSLPAIKTEHVLLLLKQSVPQGCVLDLWLLWNNSSLL